MPEDFISQMKQVISQGVSTINQGVSSLNSSITNRLEITKHQTHVDGLNRQMLEIMEKLGRTVYEGWQGDTLNADAVRVQCEALRGLESQKTALEDQIARLRAEAAGAAKSDASERPCQEEDPAQDAPPACAACGETLHPGAKFCHACGRAVQEE